MVQFKDHNRHANWLDHLWVETYYGLQCDCGAFIPHDQGPWMPDEPEPQTREVGDGRA